jgi:hypothetical protein
MLDRADFILELQDCVVEPVHLGEKGVEKLSGDPDFVLLVVVLLVLLQRA